MELEKFDLERALAGEPVITRDGKEVTQLTKLDAPKSSYPIVGVVDGEIGAWNINGEYIICKESHHNLFMKPKENAIWVNVYKRSDGSLYSTAEPFPFQKYAEEIGKQYEGYLKTVKIVE